MADKSVADLMKRINKTYDMTVVASADSDVLRGMERIEFGIPIIDMSLGGGFPHGRMIVLKGEFSSGKSMLAYKGGAAFQRHCRNCRKPMVKWNDQSMTGTPVFCCKNPEPMRVVLLDLEDSYLAPWGERLGINNENLFIAKPSYGEQAIDVAHEMVRSKMVDLVIVDSVAQIVPSVEIENSAEKQQQGTAARLMNKAVRVLGSAMIEGILDGKPPCSMIWINQIRMKTGITYGDPRTSPGGKGVEFYSSVVGMVTGKGTIERNTMPVGREVEVAWKKNKAAPPFRSGSFVFAINDIPEKSIVRGGTDYVAQIFRLATYWGEVDKSGSWYELRSGFKAQGEDKIVAELMRPENAKEIENLYALVRAHELQYANGGSTDNAIGGGVQMGKKSKAESDD